MQIRSLFANWLTLPAPNLCHHFFSASDSVMHFIEPVPIHQCREPPSAVGLIWLAASHISRYVWSHLPLQPFIDWSPCLFGFPGFPICQCAIASYRGRFPLIPP